ncbi:hypothetical protein ACPPVO_28000 [Dactylosporangium sp. McL0621]|uniref:hypothetical protein n=1 Tax=Dactylosporangium sp. McL0621 TaxID=3415678 RepID=UPI003CE8A7A5
MSAEQVLHTSTTPTGHQRTLAVAVRDALVFTEKYTGDGSGWMGRFTSFRAEARLDADPGPLVAAVADLAARGKLDLPPMAARERVADLLAAAGLLVRRDSTVPWVHLSRHATLTVAPDGRPPAITFAEYGGDDGRRHVVTEYDDIDRLTGHLAAAHPASIVDIAAGDRIGRFIAAFTAFADASGTHAGPVAALYEELGLEFEERFERRYRLLHTNRADTDCLFSLTLLVSSIENRISFSEFYDYGARPGDPGREYGYSVVTPYDSLEPLTADLEARLGRTPDGAPAQDRLAACFADLVARGALGDGRPIESNRDAVTELLTAAGVPAKPDFWVWFDSD